MTAIATVVAGICGYVLLVAVLEMLSNIPDPAGYLYLASLRNSNLASLRTWADWYGNKFVVGAS